jgi:hypothetical protein
MWEWIWIVGINIRRQAWVSIACSIISGCHKSLIRMEGRFDEKVQDLKSNNVFAYVNALWPCYLVYVLLGFGAVFVSKGQKPRPKGLCFWRLLFLEAAIFP